MLDLSLDMYYVKYAFRTAQFLGCSDALSVLADKIFQQIPPIKPLMNYVVVLCQVC